MRKLALFGLVVVAMLGVTSGVRAGSTDHIRSASVLADSGWGDPCRPFSLGSCGGH
ncbi:hypothetical protein ACEZCY_21935 [Streptacidiphilus sp. N1-12]|uniref:Uncharacterized protein n=2 Tax=Streptacidiphilus alkalitolerans TaxID=3342712 RepID=A0ABV6VDZ7_9ACTN